jgi:hypothetical protein
MKALGLALFTIVSAAAAEPEATGLMDVLDSCSSAAATDAAVHKLAALERNASNIEALMKARFFQVEHFLKGKEQTAALWTIVSDGVAQLSRPDRPLQSFEDVDANLDRMTAKDVPLMFWATLAYARTIPTISIFKRLAAAKRFHRALDRMVALDGKYFYGGPHRILSSFLARAPKLFGGDPPAALEHAKTAVALGPTFAQNQVNFAEVIILVKGASKAKAEWAPLLEQVAGLAAVRGSQSEQQAAKERARAVLGGAKVD